MYSSNATQALPFTPNMPTLRGNCSYRINQDRVVIEIAEISNDRALDNLSGTLAVELWALKQPYQGGQFNGTPLAATQIGELRGQHSLLNCRYDLLFQAPPAGQWTLTLMLREWNGMAFETTDYINFSLPYAATRSAAPVAAVSDNVITVRFNDTPASPDAPAPAAKAAPATPAPTAKAEPAAAKVATAPATTSKTATESKTQAAAAAEATPAVGKVNLNKASENEIAALKGMSRKLASAIVAGRPFASLDELLKVKGLGSKLLDKLRTSITL